MRIAITFSKDLWQGHIKLCPFSHGLFASMQPKFDLRLNKDSFYLSSVNKCCCRCDLFLNNWQMLRRITSTPSQWKCLSWSHTRLPHLLTSLAGLGPEASWWYHLNSWNLTFAHFFLQTGLHHLSQEGIPLSRDWDVLKEWGRSLPSRICLFSSSIEAADHRRHSSHQLKSSNGANNIV